MSQKAVIDQLRSIGYSEADAHAIVASAPAARRNPEQARPGAPPSPGDPGEGKDFSGDPVTVLIQWLEGLLSEPNQTAGKHQATTKALDALKRLQAPVEKRADGPSETA